MQIDELDYDLPRDLIAQAPAPHREDSRLLVLDRASGSILHHAFAGLAGSLRAGDCVVLNETKVIPARLRLVKEGTGGGVDALLLREAEPGVWQALLKPGGRIRAGMRLAPAADPSRAVVAVEARDASGSWRVRELEKAGGGLPESLGDMPLPPYIRRNGAVPGSDALRALDRERYQTVYARVAGSVAAPTAGLHFTCPVLDSLSAAGVETVKVVLHVGPGTFRPVTADRLEDHRMDAEPFEVGAAARSALRAALQAGRRIVAVGTTSARVLETLGPEGLAKEGPARGETSLFILPGFAFRVAGALVTNFHLPRSTPLALVSAFAGLSLIRRAYAEAVAARYRFLSYGDAMLIT